MRSIGMRVRLPLVIFFVLMMTLFLARLFSGPEDAWIQNEQGEWVKHGEPYGPPPEAPEDKPFQIVIPLAFLAIFIVPLFFIRFQKPGNRLGYDRTKRDMRLFGYLGTVLPLTGVLIVTGLGLEIGFSESDGTPGMMELFLIFMLSGFSGLCILLGALCFVLKRNCSDHFQLERSIRELVEELRDRPSRDSTVE